MKKIPLFWKTLQNSNLPSIFLCSFESRTTVTTIVSQEEDGPDVLSDEEAFYETSRKAGRALLIFTDKMQLFLARTLFQVLLYPRDRAALENALFLEHKRKWTKFLDIVS